MGGWDFRRSSSGLVITFSPSSSHRRPLLRKRRINQRQWFLRNLSNATTRSIGHSRHRPLPTAGNSGGNSPNGTRAIRAHMDRRHWYTISTRSRTSHRPIDRRHLPVLEQPNITRRSRTRRCLESTGAKGRERWAVCVVSSSASFVDDASGTNEVVIDRTRRASCRTGGRVHGGAGRVGADGA